MGENENENGSKKKKSNGDSIHSPVRRLNRAALGRRVFGSDPAHVRDRKVLNGIVHPAVRWAIFTSVLREYIRGQHWVVVLDIPLLFESGLDLFCGTVIVVGVRDTQTQIARLLVRDDPTTTAPTSTRSTSTTANQRINTTANTNGKDVDRQDGTSSSRLSGSGSTPSGRGSGLASTSSKMTEEDARKRITSQVDVRIKARRAERRDAHWKDRASSFGTMGRKTT